MEELYRRVSDRQTMGSVVGELRGTLGELEKLLDQFFRDPQDKTPLRAAPGHLSQMRGVLSVLGLEQAAQAVLRMRESVEEIIVTEIEEEHARAAGTFDKLGNNLGALGFLIDMLNYQPTLAKKLFVYDDSTGELRPLMGRAAPPRRRSARGGGHELSQEVQAVVSHAEPADRAKTSPPAWTRWRPMPCWPNRRRSPRRAREAAAAVSAEDSGATAAALSNLAAAVQPAPAATPAAGGRNRTSKKTTCATSSWRKRAKWCRTASRPSMRSSTDPGDVSRTHDLAPRFPYPQGQFAHGRA